MAWWKKLVSKLKKCKRTRTQARVAAKEIPPDPQDGCESGSTLMRSSVISCADTPGLWEMTRIMWSRVAVTYGVPLSEVRQSLGYDIEYVTKGKAFPLENVDDVKLFIEWFCCYFKYQLKQLKRTGDHYWQQLQQEDGRYRQYPGLDGTTVEVCGSECRYDAIRFDWKSYSALWVAECWTTCKSLMPLFIMSRLPSSETIRLAVQQASTPEAREIGKMWFEAFELHGQDRFCVLVDVWHLLASIIEDGDHLTQQVFTPILDQLYPALDVLSLKTEFQHQHRLLSNELRQIETRRGQLLQLLDEHQRRTRNPT
ncbi:hypothetical protein DIURU_002648 [Diutina rugosa]|uniref:Uncharacterized protein n=1 Tax=Diutina rugosa TaxID=5481 RepID=A0A642UP88_DIURU|nr:uncharacterized protein DIURU_002648 [Diutina rugosa]KAA8902752.1 hypothetical protein DIURU_002648 [Diutina rugosa]